VEGWTIAAYQSGPFPWVPEEDEELDITIEYEKPGRKLGDRVLNTYSSREVLF